MNTQLVILIVSSVFLALTLFVLLEWQIKKVVESGDNNSYKIVILKFSRVLYFIPPVLSIVYIKSRSVEVIIAIGVLMAIVSFSGSIMALLFTYQLKNNKKE